MTDKELKAIGIDLPDATDFLETPEKLKEFHERVGRHMEEYEKKYPKSNVVPLPRIYGGVNNYE